MRWFDGSIQLAIQRAKENRVIFIVYISGDDEVSQQMEATWRSTDVVRACEGSGCVALRLQANSDSCAQFSMIYPVVCVPCTYYIGENGVPLEVTGGYVLPQTFLDKFNQVKQMHQAQLDGTGAAGSFASTPEGTAQPSVTTPAQDNSQAVPKDIHISDDENASTGTSEPLVGTSSIPLEERVARAKDINEKRRLEKAEAEREQMKDQEKARRKLGQDMTKFKQMQKVESAKRDVEEWKKEREEQRKEKERVKRELARDRAERSAKFHYQQLEKDRHLQEREQQKRTKEADEIDNKQMAHDHLKKELKSDREEKKARFQAEKEARDQVNADHKRIKLESEHAAQAQAESLKMKHARLQFRLPDGSSITNQFSSQDTLQTARDYVIAQVGTKYGAFQLTTTFPKRCFGDEDLSSSLLDLGLAPSAVVLLIPGSQRLMSRQGADGGAGLLFTLLVPFIAIWNFLYTILFGSALPQGDAANNSRDQGEANADSGSSTSVQAGRQRPKSSYGLRRREEGNITRLSAVRDDEDDDSNTWNGNSTQQM